MAAGTLRLEPGCPPWGRGPGGLLVLLPPPPPPPPSILPPPPQLSSSSFSSSSSLHSRWISHFCTPLARFVVLEVEGREIARSKGAVRERELVRERKRDLRTGERARSLCEPWSFRKKQRTAPPGRLHASAKLLADRQIFALLCPPPLLLIAVLCPHALVHCASKSRRRREPQLLAGQEPSRVGGTTLRGTHYLNAKNRMWYPQRIRAYSWLDKRFDIPTYVRSCNRLAPTG